jgi:hypothetical protein
VTRPPELSADSVTSGPCGCSTQTCTAWHGVEIHGHPYPRVTHHFLYYFGMLSAGEHMRCKAMA